MFSERIRRRQRSWWGNDQPIRERVHRLRELSTRHAAGDLPLRPCCPLWRRTFANKLNGRELARRHGFRLPELYWSGRAPARLPVERLPPHFVVKPAFGRSSHDVYLMADGTDLLGRRPYDGAALRRRLRRDLGELTLLPLMAEEMVRSESGEPGVPIDYKCYVFGDFVAAIEAIERIGSDPARNPVGHYFADWNPLPTSMRSDLYRTRAFAPPRCLDEMVARSAALGAAFGTFVRVDCYSTERGCVFGEIATCPTQGKNFSDYAERYFEELWRDRFPDQL